MRPLAFPFVVALTDHFLLQTLRNEHHAPNLEDVLDGPICRCASLWSILRSLHRHGGQRCGIRRNHWRLGLVPRPSRSWGQRRRVLTPRRARFASGGSRAVHSARANSLSLLPLRIYTTPLLLIPHTPSSLANHLSSSPTIPLADLLLALYPSNISSFGYLSFEIETVHAVYLCRSLRLPERAH